MIETSRLILRPVCRDDAKSIFAYSSDEETTRYVTYDTYRSMDDAYVSLDRFFLNRDPETWFEAMAIVLKDCGTMIGTVDASCIRRGDEVEIGYVIHRDYWNQGIMSEAVLAYCEWLFKKKGIRRIEVTHLPVNIGSKRVAEKVGFVYEGIRRAYMLVDGEYLDMPYYSLLERDLL